MPFDLTRRMHVELVDAVRFRVFGVRYLGRTDVIDVPDGFVTDFASVPRAVTALIPRYGAYTLAAIVHDWLCWLYRRGEAPMPRRDIDGLFRRILREQQVAWTRRWCMWAAVALVDGRMRGATAGDWARVAGCALMALPLYGPPVLVTALWLLLVDLVERAALTVERAR